MTCGCGCGEVTPIVAFNDAKRGYVKGEHYKFIQGHNQRKLRQPHERPPSEFVKPDAPPSWWTIAPPKGFMNQCLAHEPRMRASRENQYVLVRTLQ